MDIPRLVNIMGSTYEVKIVEDIPGHPDAAGLCSPETLEIFICRSLTAKKRKEILFHEIIHAVIEESGVAETIPPQIEEVLCVTLSRTFARL